MDPDPYQLTKTGPLRLRPYHTQMKYSIDVNLFLYATDADNPHHGQARQFLETLIKEEGKCYLAWDTVYSFLRISTHPTIFENPLSPKIALLNITNACAALDATLVSPDETSWEIFAKLSQRLAPRGKAVPDAVLASVLEAQGVSRLYTHDRDFWKFPYLKPVDPVGRE